MIEYILARPFVPLFSLSAIVYFLVNCHPSTNEFPDLAILILLYTTLLFFLIIRNQHTYSLLLLMLAVLHCNALSHIKRNHEIPSIQDLTLYNNSTLVVSKADKNNSEFIVDAKFISDKHHCMVKINIPIKDSIKNLFYGDTLICNIDLKGVKSSRVRYFNSYNDFLLTEHIFFKAVLNDSIVVIKKYTKYSLYSISQKISNACSQIFLKSIPNEVAANLMVALLLGNKSGLDRNVKNDFMQTGTAHILAVSGLHLGMIYAIIIVLFKLLKWRKVGFRSNFLEILILLLLIWFFTFISGLSASVVRAAAMLTILQMGILFHRNSDPINSLFGCGFIMIFFNPCTMYNVGFQLSFIAVLSIILFNPYIRNIFKPKNTWLHHVWELLSVTLSVQILVTPISIYYFMQFPIYFIFSNLLWVPLSFILIILGIVLVIGHLIIPNLGVYIGFLCAFFCQLGLLGFDMIKLLPTAKLDGLWIYTEQVTIYLLSALLLFFWLKLTNKFPLFVAVVLLLFLPVIHYIRLEFQKRSNELIVYYEGNSFQFDIRTGFKLYTSSLSSKTMKLYRIAHHISFIHPISCVENVNFLLLKYNVDIKTLNYDCEMLTSKQFPINGPIQISSSDQARKRKVKSTIFTTSKSINFYKTRCDFSNKYFNAQPHELSVYGPFTLKL